MVQDIDPKQSILRVLTTDPYIMAAMLLIIVVSCPLIIPALDPSIWTEHYTFYFDAPLLAFTALNLWIARRSASKKRARDFWSYLSAGYVFWLTIRIVDPFLDQESSEASFVIDLLYLASYLCLILGLQLRPHQTAPDTNNDLIRQLESTGATLFVFGLLVYFVIIPATYNPGSFLTSIPSTMLYVVLNFYLLLRVLALLYQWRDDPWRSCYGSVALATSGYLLLDGLDLASKIDPQIDAAFIGSIFEALWLLPMLGYIAAARLFVRLRPGTQVVREPEDSEKMIWAWRGKLTYFAVVPPLIHIGLEVFGLDDELTHPSREIVVVCWMLLSAGLSLLYDRRLLDQQTALETRHQLINQQLEVAERMDAVRRMAGGLAHDFNNLLMVIRGFADVLSLKLQDPEHKDDAQQISKAALRAADLTKKLLALGNKAKRKVRSFRAEEVLKQLEPTLQTLKGVNAELKLELEATGWLLGDRGDFEDAILNLVLNAQEASKEGGTIIIKTDQLVVSNTGLLADTLGTGRYGVITVSDNGRGMDAETCRHVFEPFYSKREGGTGLGLSMVYSFAREAGGTVEVSSKVGEGTQFRIILPEGYPEEEIETAEQQKKPVKNSTRTILLVEDDEGVRSVLKRSLQTAGMLEVIEACDGEQALGILKESIDRIDLIVTDVVMPKMDGGTFARHARDMDNSLPIIFMTGFSAGQLDRLGDLAENTPILKKPFDVKDLLHEIELLLADRD